MKKQQRNEAAAGSEGGEISNKKSGDHGTKQFDDSKETCYPLHRDVGSSVRWHYGSLFLAL